jgi:hypothetical protein
MVGALLIVMWWALSLAVTLFIIYQFYLLTKRLVIANERQARALDHIAENFRTSESPAE